MGSSKQVSGILDGNVLKINRTDNITHGELLMLTAYLTESFSNRNSFSKIKIITKREYRNILEGN